MQIHNLAGWGAGEHWALALIKMAPQHLYGILENNLQAFNLASIQE